MSPRSLPLLFMALPCISTLQAENPVFHGADPHALVAEQQVWIYPTGGGTGTQFFTWSSRDLKHWKKQGPILDFKEIGWLNEDPRRAYYAWAPGVVEKEGKFYLYYSAGPNSPTPSRIGVAVSEKPAGPFRDSGKALLIGTEGFEAIDPMVFQDPADGKCYFYAGGSAGATLRVFEMAADMVSFAREISVETPPNFTEGAFLHRRDRIYYLSYSHGSYRDASYSVHYATAPTPTGPWNYRGKILTNDATHKGPGHHSFFYLPGLRQWFIAYHRYDQVQGNGPYRAPRVVCIERVEYTPGGLIQPIEMTDLGVVLPLPPDEKEKHRDIRPPQPG